MNKQRYLKVDARVRYWDDAEINGQSDESGDLVPFKDGNSWMPVIDLDEGVVVDWPEGVTAKIHFKVCDDGDYFMMDESKIITSKHNNYYVPDGLLCYGDEGFGDYIIMNIDGEGRIEKYHKPNIDPECWDAF